jgi:hypothetical protein
VSKGRVYQTGLHSVAVAKGRVYRLGQTGTSIGGGKGRIYRLGVTGTAIASVASVSGVPTQVGPGEAVNLVGTYGAGVVPDSWTWRVVSGPAVTLSSTTSTQSFLTPSVSGTAAVTLTIGVKVTKSGVPSAERFYSMSVLPQLSWVRVHGGTWVGRRVAPA